MNEVEHKLDRQTDRLTDRLTDRSLFVSIIIPTFNSADYIKDCLDSCLHQDISSDEYEIICIDDCSTDNTLSILNEYERNYENIVVVEQERNKGVSAARNRGIELARGKYIWFIDSDDFINDNVLSGLMQICLETDCEHLLFKGYYFREELTEDEIKKKKNGSLLNEELYRTEFCTHRLFRLTIVNKNRLSFIEGIKYGEDQIFNFIFQKYVTNNRLFDRIVYFHRIHNNSAMNNVNTEVYIDSIVLGADYLRDFSRNETVEQKAKTVDYMLLRISMGLSRISELPLFKTKGYLRQLAEKCFYPYKPSEDIKDLLKRKELCRRTFYLKKRARFVLKYKVIERVFHPIRTVNNVLKRFEGVS